MYLAPEGWPGSLYSLVETNNRPTRPTSGRAHLIKEPNPSNPWSMNHVQFVFKPGNEPPIVQLPNIWPLDCHTEQWDRNIGKCSHLVSNQWVAPRPHPTSEPRSQHILPVSLYLYSKMSLRVSKQWATHGTGATTRLTTEPPCIYPIDYRPSHQWVAKHIAHSEVVMYESPTHHFH